MATVQGVLSITVEDEPGERTAFPVYVTLPDTRTVAQVIGDAQLVATDAAGILDGKMVRARLILNVDLSGITQTGKPVAGSDNEETGLFTWDLTSVPGKAFGQDIPCIAQGALLATDMNKIDVADTAVAAWISRMITTYANFQPVNNLWNSVLDGPRSALKTFRKHRRQAKRT